MIDYNVEVLNRNDLENSFFHLDRHDPTIGFAYDATRFHGPTFPSDSDTAPHRLSAAAWSEADTLHIKLLVASHLAGYLRRQLEHQKGYTATVGISTCKAVSKLTGNVHKPNSQTTLLAPYDAGEKETDSNVIRFLDSHDIQKIPGIGSKLARSLKDHLFNSGRGLDSSDTASSPDDRITVRDVRSFPGMDPVLLEKILGGPGSPKGIGIRIWNLIHGVDDSEVIEARDFPTQISIEDSYRQLDTFEQVRRELIALATSLIRRMRIDLTEKAEVEDQTAEGKTDHALNPQTRWLAHPRTLRLSTRPRPPANSSGVRTYSINRASRSAPLPQYVFNLEENMDALSERLVHDLVIPMFRKLHPEKSGWNLSLLNIAVTNMVESAGEQKRSSGRDIKRMFQQQETVLKEWKVPDLDSAQPDIDLPVYEDSTWEESDEDEAIPSVICRICSASIPHFAQAAHEVYHSAPD